LFGHIEQGRGFRPSAHARSSVAAATCDERGTVSDSVMGRGLHTHLLRTPAHRSPRRPAMNGAQFPILSWGLAGKAAIIENARDRSLWRLNLDHSVVQPLLRPPVAPADGHQLSLTPFPLAAPALDLRLSSSACTPAPRWPTLRLGSVTCPRLGRRALPICIGAPRILPPVGDPSSLRLTILVSSSLRPTILVPFGLRRMALPPAWPTTYLRLARDIVLWLGWRPHTACATCRPCSPGCFPPPNCSGCFHPPA
jgi:hypothetical protein